jgi:hypothetical protein
MEYNHYLISGKLYQEIVVNTYITSLNLLLIFCFRGTAALQLCIRKSRFDSQTLTLLIILLPFEVLIMRAAPSYAFVPACYLLSVKKSIFLAF